MGYRLKKYQEKFLVRFTKCDLSNSINNLHTY